MFGKTNTERQNISENGTLQKMDTPVQISREKSKQPTVTVLVSK